MSFSTIDNTIRTIINEILDHELITSKYAHLQLLNKTPNGYIYAAPNNQILKVTSDKIEYENALKIVQKPSKYFIRYYSAKDLGNGMYELIMEKITPLDDKAWEIIDLIQNSLGSQDYMLNDQRRYAFINELKRNPEYYEDFATYEEVVDMILKLKMMYTEARSRGMILYDLRAQNIGKNQSGNYVHFDIGHG